MKGMRSMVRLRIFLNRAHFLISKCFGLSLGLSQGGGQFASGSDTSGTSLRRRSLAAAHVSPVQAVEGSAQEWRPRGGSNARESGMRTSNPTIATTITMTITLGSLKLGLAITSAAAMLRWPVPSARTLLVSPSDPPSNQPVPKPNAINRNPARIPRVPQTCRTLSMFVAVINNTSRTRLALEIQSSTGFTRRAKSS
jgi:hypothetical protein